MTREEKIQAILTAIQQDANALIVLRAAIFKNLPNVADEQLAAIMTALGLPQGN